LKVPRADSEECVFCRITRGELPSYTVFADDLAVAFLDRRPLFLGHCLVVPRGHHETLPDLPADLVGALFSRVQLIAEASERAFGADGTFIAINNRVSQSVPHLHVHVIPRRHGDGLKGFFWPRQRYRDEAAAIDAQEALRQAVAHVQTARAQSTVEPGLAPSPTPPR